MPPCVVARHRVRWISEGLVIGGRQFVSRQAGKWNEKLRLKRRKGRQDIPDEAGWCRLRAIE